MLQFDLAPRLPFRKDYLIANSDLRVFKSNSMATPSFPPAAFITASEPMLRRAPGLSIIVQRRRFRALFGATPSVCASAWGSMHASLPRAANASHFLWGLLFLKTYSSEHVSSAIAGVDEKTFRKWCWIIVSALSSLQTASSLIPNSGPPERARVSSMLS